MPCTCLATSAANTRSPSTRRRCAWAAAILPRPTRPGAVWAERYAAVRDGAHLRTGRSAERSDAAPSLVWHSLQQAGAQGTRARERSDSDVAARAPWHPPSCTGTAAGQQARSWSCDRAARWPVARPIRHLSLSPPLLLPPLPPAPRQAPAQPLGRKSPPLPGRADRLRVGDVGIWGDVWI
jgi:hypothetical protein